MKSPHLYLVGIFGEKLQLSKSSLIKQGGAYFSAISGWKSILMSAPEAYEHRECCGLLVLSLTLTLFTTSTKHHGSCWGGWSDFSLLFTRICSLMTNPCEQQWEIWPSDHPPQQEPWCFVEVKFSHWQSALFGLFFISCQQSLILSKVNWIYSLFEAPCEEAISKFTVKSKLSSRLKIVPDLAAIDNIEANS